MHQNQFKRSLLMTCLAGMVLLGSAATQAHPMTQGSTADNVALNAAQVQPAPTNATEKAPSEYSDLWLAAFTAWDTAHQNASDFNTQGRQQYAAMLENTGCDLEQLGLDKRHFVDGEWREKRVETLEKALKQGPLMAAQEKELELLNLYTGLAYGITLWDADHKRLAEERNLIERLKSEPGMRVALQAFKTEHPDLDEKEALSQFVEQEHIKNEQTSVALSL